MHEGALEALVTELQAQHPLTCVSVVRTLLRARLRAPCTMGWPRSVGK